MNYLDNPIPILQQPISSITTNTFLNNPIKLQQEIPQKIQEPINKTITEINKNVSITFIDILDELLNKPSEISIQNHVHQVLKVKNRYTYIGILFIFISLYLLLIK